MITRLGAESEKLLIGMPTYGRTYTLVDPNENGMRAPAVKDKGGDAGDFTQEAGILAYYEVTFEIVRLVVI